MTQIDTSTPAIIARCEHIEHCALGGSHKDAERMRALAEERDTLNRQVEDCARVCAKQAEEILRLRALVPHPDETDLEYILRETNRGVRIEDIAKARGITRERARLKLAKAREQLGGYTPQQVAALRAACATILPLVDAMMEEKVTDVSDWERSVAQINAALEANQ